MESTQATGAENKVPDVPLTDWAKPPTLMQMKQDMEDAKPAHDKMKARVQKWLENLNVEGPAKVKSEDGRSAIVPKLIRKQAEWRYPALSDPFLSSEDVFNVSPVSWEDRKAAQQNQIVLNNQFNTKIDKVSFFDDYVRAAVDEGTVVVRVGWDSEEETYTDMVPKVQFVVNPAMQPMMDQLDQMEQESPSQYDLDVPEELKQAHELSKTHRVPIEPRVIGYEQATLTRLVKNQPTLEVCDINNVIIDPSCNGDITKAAFVIYTFETNKARLNRDGRYKNLDQIVLDSNSPLNTPDYSTSSNDPNFNFKDDPRKLFLVHEYWGFWDVNGDGVMVPFVAAWVGNTLIRMEESPFPDKQLPFVVIPYLPKRRQTYGEPDGALLEDNQKIIGAVTRGMIDTMGRSANGQMGIRKDMLDATNRRRFDKGLDYEFNPNVDPRQGVYMHTYPEIPASAQYMLQSQQFEAESMTGVKAFNNGIGSQSLGDVAAGIRGALDAASKRELAILRRLSKGVIQIGRKILAMNHVFLSDKEVVRVTNEEFVSIRRDDLAGSFDLKLSISTAEEDNNKAQELAFLLQTTGNTMDPGLSKMILSDITRLRKMPDLAKRIEAYQPQPDPLLQRKQQLEVLVLEAQLKDLYAQAQERQAGAQLDMARANTERTKAANIQSDTDQRNLDFVEQESGVKQERALQLHGEQARSQAKLKLLERVFDQQDKHYDLVKEYIKQKAA